MSHGACGQQYESITEDDIKKVKPCCMLLSALYCALARAHLNLDDLAYAVCTSQPLDNIEDSQREEIETSYNTLINTFEKITGLPLAIGHHDQENEGSPYDDINGSFWALEKVYTLSDDAKKLRDKYKIDIKTVGFVTYG